MPPSSTIATAMVSAASLPIAIVVGERPAVVGEIADIGRERARVGAEALEQQVVDDDREPEGREHRHQQPAARAALEHQALQRPADQRHRRRDQAEAEKRLDAEAVGQNEERVGREHREAAVREIDDAHDAEHEREPAGDQRVIAAEQHALDDLVEEDHGGGRLARGELLEAEIGFRDLARGSARCVGPSMAIAPSSMQMVRLAVAMARFRSCSTRSIATPDVFSASSRA